MKNSIIIVLLLICFNCSNHGETKNSLAQTTQNQELQIEKRIITYEALVPDSLIYDIINYIIDDRYNNFESNYKKCTYIVENWPYNLLTKKDSLKLLKLNNIFSQADLEFVFKQNQQSKYFVINTDFIDTNLDPIQKDSLDKYITNSRYDNYAEFYERYGNHGFVLIKLPLFSVDKKTVIVSFSINLAPLNGEHVVAIYIKTLNRWERIYTLYAAIS